MSYSDSVASVESGGDPNAQNPNSSAAGLGQFIDSTWLNVLRQHRPDLANGKSDADLLALKNDPDLSRQMIGAYGQDNAAILTRNGLPVTSGSQYLAHFAGPQGAVSLLKADSNTPAAAILGPAVAKANPFIANMSAGDLIAWADRKMGTSQGTGRPAGAAGGVPQGGPPQPQISPGATAGPPAGILNAANPPATQGGPGILNGGLDATTANFQNELAALMAAREPQAPVSALPPIQFALPKGLPRARLLAALSSPVGG